VVSPRAMRSNFNDTAKVAALAMVALVGCSNGFESEALGVRYQPPRGFRLVSEDPGVAIFSSGLEIRSIPSAAIKLDETPLAGLLNETLATAKLPAAGRIVSAKAGDLTAGPVARYEVEGPNERTLIYVVPQQTRRILVTFTAGESRYRELATRVETSLASLRLASR
jgi:hypothetical protein